MVVQELRCSKEVWSRSQGRSLPQKDPCSLPLASATAMPRGGPVRCVSSLCAHWALGGSEPISPSGASTSTSTSTSTSARTSTSTRTSISTSTSTCTSTRSQFGSSMSQSSYTAQVADPMTTSFVNITTCTDCYIRLRQPDIAAYRDCGLVERWVPPFQPSCLVPSHCTIEQGHRLTFCCKDCVVGYPATFFHWRRLESSAQEDTDAPENAAAPRGSVGRNTRQATRRREQQQQ